MPNTIEKIKQAAWIIIFWPIFFLLRIFRLIIYPIRQDFHIGYLHKHITITQLKKHLFKKGFSRQPVAWIDIDEVLSVRKPHNIFYQYHLRLYKDKEVRGHYEFKPESKPITHIKGTGMEDRYNDFLNFLGHLIIPDRHFDKTRRENNIPQSASGVASLTD